MTTNIITLSIAILSIITLDPKYHYAKHEVALHYGFECDTPRHSNMVTVNAITANVVAEQVLTENE